MKNKTQINSVASLKFEKDISHIDNLIRNKKNRIMKKQRNLNIQQLNAEDSLRFEKAKKWASFNS